MSTRYPMLYFGIQVFSVLMVLILFIAPKAVTALNTVLAPCLIVFLGIPHGAADHRIFQTLQRSQLIKVNMTGFYASYLGLMLGYAGLWYWSPTLSLGAFLGLSCYHFGQSNWNYLNIRNPYSLALIHLLYGIMVLIVPILWHIEEATPIIEAILGYSLPPLDKEYRLVIIASVVFLNIAVMGGMWRCGAIDTRQLGLEVIQLFVLVIVFMFCPLLLGFSIYFAAWHALSSIQDQIQFFRSYRSNYNWWQYVKECLPYTVLSIVGLIGFVYGVPLANFEQGLGILFIFLSLITLPHMVLIDMLYRNQESAEVVDHV